MFTKAKDWTSGKLAGAWIRDAIGRYAELKEFGLDRAAKKFRVLLRLKGETDDTEIRVDRYEVTQENGKHWVAIMQLECSKEWVRLIAIDHLIGKKFELPSAAAKLL